MNIPEIKILELKFPEYDMMDINIVELGYDEDNNLRVVTFNIPNTPVPTMDEIRGWGEDEYIQKQYKVMLNHIYNQPIIAQLNELDLVAIRPLMENDTQRIAQLNAEKSILRAQLLPTDTDLIILGDL